MRYSKILVALDRSPQAEVVFEQALELAIREEAALMLFHCLPLETQGIGSYYTDMFGRELINVSGEIQVQLRKEREEARTWLTSYCQKATAQGLQTEWDLRVGDAGQGIRELAQDWQADLVVLGRRGRRGLTEMLLGSVSSYVVHHVPCSVLVVQGINATTGNQISVAATQVESTGY